MPQLLVSILIGCAAALIDTAPMLLRKLDPMFIASAFMTWVILAILIPRTNLIPLPWLNGIAVSLLVVIPMTILIARLDPRALPLIIATTLVLGAAVGFLSQILLKRFQ